MMVGNHAYSTVLPSPNSFPHIPVDLANNDESSEIRCICLFTHDDGFTIACDQCDTWQHGFCVDVDRTRVPDKYLCPACNPRPLDVRKAKEYQLRYSKDREEKSRRKKPKSSSATNSSRRKDNPHHALQNGHGARPSTEKSSGNGKPPTPKEGQHARKRGSNRNHAIPNSHATSYFPEHNNATLPQPTYPYSNGAPSPALTVAPDRNLEVDSDTDMERPSKIYTIDFTDISEGSDQYGTPSVQKTINSMITNSLKDPTLRRMTSNDVSPLSLPETSVSCVAGNSNSYPSSYYFITVDVPCPKGQLVAVCKGLITDQKSYKMGATNQYSLIRHPKPYVLFHPSQPFCIDSRIRGTISRFVGRSCRPNTSLSTILVDNSKILFGLFATEPLKASTPLTIEWEWSGCPAIQKVVQGFEPEQLDADEYADALSWVNDLTSHVGECACSEKEECILAKIRVKQEVLTPKAFPTSSRSRQGSRPHHDTFPTPVSDNASPVGPTSPDQDDSIQSSKHQSRDLSPTTSVHGEISSREAKKMQDIVSRIEKIEQGEYHITPAKRRKRSNTSVAHTNSGDKSSDSGRKSKISSTATSQSPPPSSKSSPPNHSPQSPQTIIQDMASVVVPPQATIKRIKMPEYVDCSMQTDECEDDWWNHPSKMPPAKPQLSLKERLMKRMLREREQAQDESRKRKQSEMVDAGSGPLRACKGQKLTKESDVKTVAPKGQALNPAVECVVEEKSLLHTSNTAMEITQSSSNPDVFVPHKTSNVQGPALVDIFADSPPALPAVGEQKLAESTQSNLQPVVKSPPSSSRNLGLQAQLPVVTVLANTSTSPAPGSRCTTSPSPLVASGAVSQSPVVISPPSATSSNVPLLNATSAPTKTKKMSLSLSEYGKRRGRGDHFAEKDKKVSLATATEGVTTRINGAASD